MYRNLCKFANAEVDALLKIFENKTEHCVVGKVSKEAKYAAENCFIEICVLEELHNLMNGDAAILNLAGFNVSIESILCAYVFTAVVTFAYVFKANALVNFKLFISCEVSVTAVIGASAEETVTVSKMLVVFGFVGEFFFAVGADVC